MPDMSLREKRCIVIGEDGICELQVDRVKGDGATAKRRKVSRKKVTSSRVAPGVADILTLPAGCKMIRVNQTRTTFVIEQMPQVRTVGWTYLRSEWWNSIQKRGCLRKFGLTEEDFENKVFRLSFPFMVFVVTLHGLEIVGMHVFFRTEPLRSESDHLYYASITNYCVGDDGDGKLCTMRPKITEASTQSTLAEDMVDLFWSSTFIGDWTERYDAYCRTVPELATIWDWQYHSRVDPSWVLRSDWTNFGQSIGELLGDLVQIPDGRDRSTVAFNYFQTAIAGADEYHGEAVGQAHGNLAPSPSTSVKIGQTIIRQGDLMRRTGPAVNGLKKNKSYKIEYFFEPTDEGLRFAKFAGMDKPVSIGISIFAGFELVKKADNPEDKVFKIGGVDVGIGSRFMVSDNSDFPQLELLVEYVIEDIHSDSDGDIAIKISGYDFFYITTGGKLFDSVSIVQPKFKDDKFSCGARSIKVGQFVRVTATTNDRLNGKVVKVSKIWADGKIGGRYFVHFVGVSGNFALYDTSGWRIDFIDHPFQYADDSVTFGEHTLDLASL